MHEALRTFFQAELDYIFFCYGLSFMLLAGACFLMDTLGPRRPTRATWFYLGWFGVVHGFYEWFELLSLHLVVSAEWFFLLKFALLNFSFVLLLEFARVNTFPREKAASGFWIYPLLFFVVFLGGILNTSQDHFFIFTRYGFAFTASVWSGILLWREGARNHSVSALRYAGAAFFLYAFAAGICGPRGSFFPASMVNQEAFFSLTGFPVQALRCFLAFFIAAVVWKVYQNAGLSPSFFFDRRVRNVFSHATVFLLVFVLLAGWFVTYGLTGSWENEERQETLQKARIAAAAIDTADIKALKNVPEDILNPAYERLRRQMALLQRSDPEARWFYTMQMQPSGKFIFQVDSIPEKDFGHTDPGGVFYEEPPVELLKAYDAGLDIAVGPYVDEWGSFMSGFVLVRDPQTKDVVTVLGLDVDARDWYLARAAYRLLPMTTIFLIILLLVFVFLYYQKELEAARRLADAGETLAKAQKIAKVGSWTYNTANREFLWSDEMYRIFGVSRKTPLPSFENFIKMIRPADRMIFDRIAARDAESLKTWEEEMRVSRADGSLRHVISRGDAQAAGPDGGHIFLGTFQDVTERKALEAQTEELQNIITRSQTFVFLCRVDETWSVEMVSGNIRALGYEPEEFARGAFTFRDLVFPEDLERVARELSESIRKGASSIHLTYRMVTRALGVIWVHDETALRFDEDGQLTHFQCIVSDVSEQVKMEQQLEAKMKELERYHKIFLGREQRILELKKKIRDLSSRDAGSGGFSADGDEG